MPRSRTRHFVALGIVAAAGVAVVITRIGSGDGRGDGPRPAASEAARIESAVIELGDQPYALDADGTTLWVSGGRGHLVEVHGDDVVRHPHPTGPLGIAVAGGIVWTTSPGGEASPVSEVTGFDARTGEVAQRIALRRASPYGIDADDRHVYVALYDGALLDIHTRTGDAARVELGEGVTHVLAAHGFVWVSQPGKGAVWRVADGRTSATQFSFGGRGTASCPQGSDATAAAVLVADPCAGKVWVVDPRSGSVADELTDVGRRPVDVAAGGRLIYVVSMRDDRVTVLDGKTLREVAHATAGDGAIGVTAGAGGAWVANGDEYSVTRIDVRLRS